jgi:hypothetical protein
MVLNLQKKLKEKENKRSTVKMLKNLPVRIYKEWKMV